MKRFYTVAAAAQAEGGWQVTLDGRGVKSQAGKPQCVPSQRLADALAAEWAAQGEDIVPASFLLRDMADYAIDVVAPDRASAIAALLPYAETDTLCYRADPAEALHRRQMVLWEPLLTQAEQRWDIAFTRISGIIHQAQPAATLARLALVLEAKDNFTLAALRSLAGLSASMIIGLAASEAGADAEVLWSAANLEEDFQAEFWGQDAEAQALRARRFRDFSAAMHFVSLL
ncbi:MAG: hypothetical protein RLZZ136_286 [Pseudomonadota bacterium]|jgi:chaperone required for assembly of F1-ATPase